MFINVDFNIFFLLSIWILKLLIIKILFVVRINSDVKLLNFLIKFVWCFGGLYIVVSINIIGDLLLILVFLDNVI